MAEETPVKKWKTALTHALAYQEKFGKPKTWDKARDYYMNRYSEHEISVNLIFAIGRALVPQLYFKTPTILVQPDKEEFVKLAPVVEAIDKKLVVSMGMKHQLKLGILDSFVTNLTPFKFGYSGAGVALPTQEPVETLSGDALKLLEGLNDPDLAHKVVTEDEALSKYSYHDWVKPEHPWMLRVDSEDFLVPWGTKDPYSAPWCAFRVVMLLEDFMKNPAYSNKIGLKANTTLLGPDEHKKTVTRPNTFKQAGQVGSGEGPNNAVEFYEIFDKRTGEIIAVHMDRDKFFQKEKHGMNIQGLPVEILQFNPTSWSFWGVTDVDQIVQQQLEYNETRTLELKHKRTSITKFLYDKGAITPTEFAKFMSGELAGVGVEGNPHEVIAQLNQTMSRDLFNVSDVIRTDISEILGFSRNQAGEFDVARRTATEAGIVQKALEIRSDERRDQVADLIAAAFQRKINPLIFSQWTEQNSINVTGKEGWVDFTGPQIKGDYSVSVIADSVVPLSQAQRQQAATTALELFRGDPMVDQRRLYEWSLAQFQSMGVPPDLLVDEKEAQQNKLKLMLENLAGGTLGKGGQGNGNRPA